MSLEEVDDLCLLTGTVKFRDEKKWKVRHANLRRLSPVANTLHLQLFKDGPKGLQSKASLSLDNFRAMETGFTLDRESNTLALLCEGSCIVLAFDAREALLQWHVKIAASVPYVQQFAAELLVAPVRSRLRPAAARLHVQDLRVSLVTSIPPRLAASWPIADLRRYGPAEGRYVLEGGARCGRGAGLHVLGVSTGQGQLIDAAMQEAAQCRLQARRKLNRKSGESPHGASRRSLSRSCSRDGTLRSRDGDPCPSGLSRDTCAGSMPPREAGQLCRQASLQWSTWSSDDCDLEYEPMDGSRANGDGQSEVSVSSSGSESASRRLHSSTSGHCLRSPRPTRRCSADCACALKTTRSCLRRTGVLDEPLPEQRSQSQSSTPVPVSSSGPADRFTEHVYEEPKEKHLQPITGRDSSQRRISGADTRWRETPSSVIRTVAEVHGVESAAGYDRPRPGARRLSPEGIATIPDHVYEDPGPADGWYQTPRPCEQCQLMKQSRREHGIAEEGRGDGAREARGGGRDGARQAGGGGGASGREVEVLYKRPGCHCVSCGGDKAPVVPDKTDEVDLMKSELASSGCMETPGYETIPEANRQLLSMTSSAPVTSSGRPRVDGTGRMPVLNASTGELEVPAQSADGSLLCPRIPSEIILGQGLYSKPGRPAYAVIDKGRRTLIPGLPQPPVSQPRTENDYANTPTSCGHHKNHYVNMAPTGADVASSGGRDNQYVNTLPLNGEGIRQGGLEHSYSNVAPTNSALNVADMKKHTPQERDVPPGGETMHQHLSMSPAGAMPPTVDRTRQYVNIGPEMHPKYNNQYLEMTPKFHQTPGGGPLSPYTPMAPVALPTDQPAYANLPPVPLDGSCGGHLYANTAEHRQVSAKPPVGNYLDMTAGTSLRRSRSVDNGTRRTLRSLSLGRKPMPSPKPERIRLARTESAAIRPTVVRCAPPPVAALTSSGGTVTSHPILSDVIRPPDQTGSACGQSHLSAAFESCSTRRGSLASLKPRSGAEYQKMDRSKLLTEIGEPPRVRSLPSADSHSAVDI